MNFPNGFKEKYQHLLGEDAAAFFATFEQEAVSAFRTNPLKEAQKAFEMCIRDSLTIVFWLCQLQKKQDDKELLVG